MKKVNFKNIKGGPSNIILLGLLVLLSMGGLARLIDLRRSIETIKYSEFVKNIKQNNVNSVTIAGSEVQGTYKTDKKRFETIIPENDTKVKDLLETHSVDLSYEMPSTGDFSWWHLLMLFSLVLTPLGLWYFLRQSRGNSNNGASGIFNIGKSKARMFMPSQIKVNFDSVAGVIEAKEELREVVDFLKNPEKYQRLGAKLPRGVLLVGEPGNGKTLLAKAVAGEAHCPFFSISGSDFIEVFVGVGASRVRDLFKEARKKAPCIVFIDEIDAVGRQRGNGTGGGNDEREQTLNQLLSEMDGFNTIDSSVVVIAATNRPDVLDKALLRPGRFDRRVTVPFPDLKSREDILRVHAKNVTIDPSVDLKKIARGTPGFSGAQLANLINEAALFASCSNQDSVNSHNLEDARDKIMVGKEQKSIIRDKKELEMTAYHEAGHALMRLLQPEYSHPLHKVTILARGNALGITYCLPEKDKYSESYNQMLAEIKNALGGRAAEELVYKDVTTGASSDFAQSTEMARQIVALYGMSEKLGPVMYNRDPNSWYRCSEATAQQIDEEVRSLIIKLYKETLDTLKTYREKLDKLALELLEKETMQAREVYQLLEIESREEHSFS